MDINQSGLYGGPKIKTNATNGELVVILVPFVSTLREESVPQLLKGKCAIFIRGRTVGMEDGL